MAYKKFIPLRAAFWKSSRSRKLDRRTLVMLYFYLKAKAPVMRDREEMIIDHYRLLRPGKPKYPKNHYFKGVTP